MLSEYFDDALDPKNRELVTVHLSTCEDCREALNTIEKLSARLQQLPIKKAPQDFMDRLHQKLHPAPWWKRLYSALFVPFKIKVPLELAAATAVAVLVFFVFSVQQQDPRMMTPASMEKMEKDEAIVAKPSRQKMASEEKASPRKYGSGDPSVDEKVADAETPVVNQEEPESAVAALKEAPLMSATKKDQAKHAVGKQKRMETSPAPSSPPRPLQPKMPEVDRMRAMASENMETPKPKSIELVLAMDTASPADALSGRKSISPGKSSTATQRSFALDTVQKHAFTSSGREAQHVDMITKIKELADGFGGRLVYVEHDPSGDSPIALQLTIPSMAYDDFCNALAPYGTLRTPTPKLSDTPQDPLPIKLFLK